MKMILAPRRAYQTYALQESIKKSGNVDDRVIAAKIVYDSARSAVKLFNPLTWLNLLLSPARIMRKYADKELGELCGQVLELEGLGKKKVPETENQSDEQSPVI